VKEDEVKIKWRPPTDDGGLDIQKYSIEKLEQDTWIRVWA